MGIDFLLDVFREQQDEEAIVWQGHRVTYGQLLQYVEEGLQRLETQHIESGMVVMLDGDFSPTAISMLLALMQRGCVVVPITQAARIKKARFCDLAEVEAIVKVDAQDGVTCEMTTTKATHPLLMQLKAWGHPGLILFTSGATGESKAIVHDAVRFMEKFKERRHRLRTLHFLLFDHIAGLNTLFYTLANAGGVITVQERSPDAVCAAIETYHVQLLPTSPTFLNLLLLSEAYKQYDLSSLELITYGTEVMPESTLSRLTLLFPTIKIFQQFGASEIGVPRTQSKARDSVWIKLGGPGFEARVVDGMLQIKSPSPMLGYLNAASPFTEDGWFKTGDAVEVDGAYYRILGRTSEMINIGGEKVYPAEVESVMLMMEGVADVTVTGEPNSITGYIVKAVVKLNTEETLSDFRRRMRRFCADKLLGFQIPQKVVLVQDEMHGERFKKIRRTLSATSVADDES